MTSKTRAYRNFQVAKVILVFTLMLCGCSKESEREHGIKLASEGRWSEAIEILEKYVNSEAQAQKFPPASKAEESLFRNVDIDKFHRFLKAVFYLLASYLGEAGLNLKNLIDSLIKISELDVNKENFECDISKIVKEKIIDEIFGENKESQKQRLQKQIFNLYKAQRIYEKIMYGEGEKLDKYKGLNIPDYGDISSVDPDKDTKIFEIKRIINSIEYLGGKILVWRTVLSSTIMRHPDYYIQNNCERKETKKPSLCCLLKKDWPYEKEKQKLLDMEHDLMSAVALIINGIYAEGSDELMNKLGSRYIELEQRLLNSFQKSVSSSCEKYSKEFLTRMTETISEQITGINIITVEVEPGVDREEGIWICPRRIDMEVVEDMYMCESSLNYKNVSARILDELQEVAEEIPFPRGSTTQFQIRGGDNCFDCKKSEFKCERDGGRTIYIRLVVDKMPSPEELKQICNSLTQDQFVKSQDIPKILVDKLERAVKDILESREDPAICFY